MNKLFTEIGVIKEGVIQPMFLRYMYQNAEAIKELSVWPGDTPKEQLYCMLNNLKERPLCSCGKKTKFINTVEGYRKHCSSKCSNNDKNTKDKYKEHMLKTYGVEHYSQTDEYKKKFKETSLKRFGTEHPSSCDKIKRKKEQTFLSEYGYTNVFGDPELRKQWNRNAMKKFYDSLFTGRLQGRIKPLFSFEEYKGIDEKHEWECCTCGTIFKDHLKFGKIPLCPQCYGVHGVSRTEKEVVEWLQSLGITLEENYRKLIPPKEVDIYIPTKQLAIEINGIYWHGELRLGKNYHIDKMKACSAQGVRLLQFWDEEWRLKKSIIQSIILSALGLYDKNIYGRKTQVAYISRTQAKEFLEENHLQGYAPSSQYIGLLYGNELVSVLTLGKPRFSARYTWEIIRYANAKNTRVIGSFNKMFSFFRRNQEGSVITYSDARLFTGQVYEKAGFTPAGLTPPSYLYAPLNGHGSIKNRYQSQKHKIENVDVKLTEYENMQLKGFDRVWDCGNWKFVLE